MATHKEESFNFAQPGEHVIIHREGAPEREPRALSYEGRIDAPRAFVEPKLNAAESIYNPDDATATIDTDAGAITLKLAQKAHDADTITGKLEPDTALAALGINSDTVKYSSSELAKKVKRLGHFFASREEQTSLIVRLNNFSAKVTKAFEDNTSNSGNAKKSLEITVSEFEPITFKLSAPLFKGDEKQTFVVEVGVDATSNNVLLFLDSPELFEADYRRRRELLKVEADFFTKWGAAVIYRS